MTTTTTAEKNKSNIRNVMYIITAPAIDAYATIVGKKKEKNKTDIVIPTSIRRKTTKNIYISRRRTTSSLIY
jgi:hypothetical protein